MSTTTTNYNMTKPDTTDNIDVSVLNDNFDTIDAELKNCMDAASTIVSSNLTRHTVSLSTTWGGEGPYTQTVTIPNATITANSKVDLQPSATALVALISGGVKALWIENNNGTLTAKALGAAPNVALTMQCTVSDTTKALDSIVITTQPTQTTYVSGTALDLTGMVVTATYSDGSTADVTDDCTSIPAEGQIFTTSGTQTVTVSYAYGGVTKTATFTVTVLAAVTAINVTTMPTTTAYAKGDTLDLTGLVVTATYSNGETAVVTNGCVFDPDDGDELSIVGTQEVEISYTENSIEVTTIFNVVVESPALSSIAVTTQPTTTTYTSGDALDLTGIEITATYANGDTDDVTNDCVFSPDDGDTLSTVGIQTVSVAYSEGTVTALTSFSVTVGE